MTIQEAIEIMRLKPNDIERLSVNGIMYILHLNSVQMSRINTTVEKERLTKEAEALNTLLKIAK